jgi:hypothetical protein
MSTQFPFTDPDRAREFALGYFERLRADPDIRKTWLGLRALIQVRITRPDIAVYVDTRNGETMNVTPGIAPEPPALTLTLSADAFHRIYGGEMNVFLAFATRQIKTQGNVALIMKTTWTLPQAIRIYRRYGAELSLPGFEAKRAVEAAAPVETTATTRVGRLLERRLHTRPEVCVERARYYTASMQQTEGPALSGAEGPALSDALSLPKGGAEGEPQVIRQAKALAHVLANLTVHIEPDELIVGAITGKALGGGVYPEGVGSRVAGELETIGSREPNPFTVTDEQLRELRDEIFPRWRGKTLEDVARARWSPQVTNTVNQVAVFIPTEIGGIGHMLLNYEGILSKGLEWYVREAEERKSVARNTRQTDFYQAAAIACRGVIHFAERYVEEAERLATVGQDGILSHRRQELAHLAEVCRHVPAHPARTFHEALQAMQFVLVAAQIEDYESGTPAVLLHQSEPLYPPLRRRREPGLRRNDRLRQRGRGRGGCRRTRRYQPCLLSGGGGHAAGQHPAAQLRRAVASKHAARVPRRCHAGDGRRSAQRPVLQRRGHRPGAGQPGCSLGGGA